MPETPQALHAAVFLDRDGVVNEEVGYLRKPEQLRLIPGAAVAIRRVNQQRVPAVVATNQSAVARGICTEGQLQVIHHCLSQLLEAEGAYIDRFYYCPHHPLEGLGQYRINCYCRKPRPGLLRRAALELNLNLQHSVFVGDNITDLQAGWDAGCKTVLVLTGHGEATRDRLRSSAQQPDFIADDLGAAVDWILGQPEMKPLIKPAAELEHDS
jgi:D-glycero-D-manno-heptose 1,7-bisphosphate phosphatase